MRTLNTHRVLEYAWSVPAFTASDAMTATGLTRSTVIGVCDGLVASGWLEELGDARAIGDYRKGRPARRYSLHEAAGAVIGVDAGYDRMSATVADLRGRVLGRAESGIPSRSPHSIGRLADADGRRALAQRLVNEAIESAMIDPARVLAVTVGVPAPVDAAGASPDYDTGFWRLMNPDLGRLFHGLAPIVTVENDANLVAIAERSSVCGRGRGLDSYVALLVGEGFGAGLMIDRRLVRGRRGGAGEMRFLDHVSEVGSADGLALCARRWATEAIESGRLPERSPLALVDPAALREADVTLAAEAGDPVAAEIIERLAARLAQICLVLGDLLDVDRIIVAGSAVDTMPTVIRRAGEILDDSVDPASPELVPSALGPTAVRTGAIEHALGLVRERVLDLTPRPHR